MKKLIKNAIFALMLMIGVNVTAADGIDVKVEGNQIIEIALREKGTLTFQDGKGEILYKDSCVSGDAFIRKINLSEIPNGAYYLKFDKEDSILTSEVVKSDSGIKINPDSSEIVFKPVFRINNKMVGFLLTNPTESKAKLKVYDSEGTLVGIAETNDSYVFKRTLDFSNMPAGKYMISLSVNGNNFMKEVSIDL